VGGKILVVVQVDQLQITSQALKVGCNQACSFAGIFFRNAISIGPPDVELPGGDKLFVDSYLGEVGFAARKVINLIKGKS